MAKCAYCNSTIILGGVRDGDMRFCNATCHEKGALLVVSQLVPDAAVQRRLAEIHQGACPHCQRTGSIDLHTAHSVWSALVMTSWKSEPKISCTPCGKKAKAMASVSSLFLGWWGFPWGLIMTPVQVSRNLWGICVHQPSFAPSPQLERVVRLGIAAELQHAQSQAAPPPVLKKS